MSYFLPTIYGQAPAGGGGNMFAALLQQLGMGGAPGTPTGMQMPGGGQNQNMYSQLMQMMAQMKQGQGGAPAMPNNIMPNPGPGQINQPPVPATPTGPPGMNGNPFTPPHLIGNITGPGRYGGGSTPPFQPISMWPGG